MPFSTRALVRLLGMGITPLVFTLGLGEVRAQEQEQPTVISNGRQVSIEYSLKLADGSVADSNVGSEALTYEQGASQILPALEQELLGLKVGDQKRVSLTAAQGYGEVDPELFQTVPTAQIPEDARRVGAQLLARTAAGDERPVRVHEVNDEEITVNLNHPLAGEALEFEIRILAIE